MYLKKLEFKGFKNLDGVYTPDPHLNILIYPNGWGKTNLLEGIDYLSSLKSFRGLSDKDLLDWEKDYDFGFVEARISNNSERILKIVIANIEDSIKKSFFLNSAKTSSIKIRSNIKTILYSPHNADIISSAPDIRRNEFDRLIAQFQQGYLKLLGEYKYVLKNRNKLLIQIKEGKTSYNQMDYWNERFIKFGEEIINSRLEFLQALRPHLEKRAGEIFSDDFAKLKVEYISKSFSDKKIFLSEKILSNVDKEISAGMTLYGPHRDDYTFSIKEKNLREFGSRGQQRLAGLALVFGVADLIESSFEESAIILLDDIMSELDKSHRNNIEKLIRDMEGQVFITSSEKAYFSSSFIKKGLLL